MHLFLEGVVALLSRLYQFQNLYITPCPQQKQIDTTPTSQKQKYQKCSISSTNVRGCIWSNFPEVEYHLYKVKLDLMFQSKTSLNLSILIQDFTILGYSLLMVKYSSWNHHSVLIIRMSSQVAETPKMRTCNSCSCASMWPSSIAYLSSSLSIIHRMMKFLCLTK